MLGNIVSLCKKYQTKVAVQHDKTTYHFPAGMPRAKIKASIGVWRLLHNMRNVHCDLKRKEDELRKCVMNGSLSLRVSSTRSNCVSSKALPPKTLLY